MVSRGEVGGGRSEIGEGDYEGQTSSYKISHGNVMYIIGNTVNNIVRTLYGDRW